MFSLHPSKTFTGSVPFAIIIILLLWHLSLDEARALPIIGSSDPFVTLDLNIEFNTTTSGNIDLYFGTAPMEYMKETVPETIEQRMDDNEVFSYMWDNLFVDDPVSNLTDTNISKIMDGVLQTDEEMTLHGFNIIFYINSDEKVEMGIGLAAMFRVNGSFSRLEYRYLEFIHEGNLATDRDLKKLKSKYIDQKDYIGMTVKITGGDPLSMTFREETMDHTRERNGEKLEYGTTYTKFVLMKNELMVHDSHYKSPSFIFKIFIATVIIGYLALIIIWYRNRFKGRGLVLPFFTLFLSIFVWAGYYYPGLSIYSIGAATYYFISGSFILVVMLCHFVNPKPKNMKGYDEMREKEKKLKVKKVAIPIGNYMNTNIPRPTSEDGRSDYEILDVGEDASPDEIKKAYFGKMKDYHPDKYQDAPEKIRESADKEASLINEAYDNLVKYCQR